MSSESAGEGNRPLSDREMNIELVITAWERWDDAPGSPDTAKALERAIGRLTENTGIGSTGFRNQVNETRAALGLREAVRKAADV